MAAAHVWHDGVGSPGRKVPTVVQILTGLQVTQGALTQDALRQAQEMVGTADEQLRAAVPAAPVVHPDDTGWRVGGEPASLMAFEIDAATVSQIRSRHRHEEVQEVIPADYAGVMVTDRGRSYEAQACDRIDQHKCLAHMLRSSSDVVETKTGRACDFGAQLKALLQEALGLWHAHRDGQVPNFKVEAEALEAELTFQRRDRRRQEPDNQRRRNELGGHHDRGHLRRFLADPRNEPTNHRAERALRPAVIARQVSHGLKSGRGADAFAAFTRVIRTPRKAGAGSVVEALSELFRPTQPQHIPNLILSPSG
jgi:transposase